MKNRTRRAIGSSVLMLLLLLGLMLMTTGCTTEGAGNIVTKTHSISDSFTEISVDCAECNIRILPSEDGSVEVVCKEREKYPHSVSVREGKLVIEEPSRTELFNILALTSEHTEVTIYLPEAVAAGCDLELESASGNFTMDQELSFRNCSIDCASGDINCRASFSGELEISAASGEIQLSNLSCEDLSVDCASGSITLNTLDATGDIELEAASGKIKVIGTHCRGLDAEVASGSLTLEDVIAEKEIKGETASGNISLLRCDAASYQLESSSGNIKGSVLSEMRFVAESSSGRINVPNTDGGTCRLYTDSGNIDIEIAK
ncbi:MAG: DUF4097 family beta strand repeat protein [Oscillospiraceae bacterium]|nr:DUF4097 family beta strand repeat protein [Oscillospiraceae bacterium]